MVDVVLQLALSDRVAESVCLLLSAVETAERRRALGLREFARWHQIVWDVVRIQAERRSVEPFAALN